MNYIQFFGEPFYLLMQFVRLKHLLDYNVNSFNQLRKTAIASYLASPVRQFKLDGLANSINKDRL